MKHLTILYLSLLTVNGVQGQGIKQDTTHVLRLIDTARAQQQRGLADAAENHFRRAGDLAKQLDFDRGLLMYAGHYCVFLYEQVRYEDAMRMAQLQLEVGKRLNDKQRIGYAYNNLSLQYQAMGKLRQAAESLMKALDISSEIDNPTPRDLADRRKYYNNLSSLLLDMDDLEKGRQYALKALEIAEQQQDTLAIGRSLVNVLVAEAMAKRLDEAEQHGQQLLAIGQSQGDVQMEIRAYNNLGDIYRMQKKFAPALETFRKAHQLLDRVPPGNEVYVLMGISSTYKDWGRYREAESYYHRAQKLAGSELAKPQLSELYLSGAEIMEGLGAYHDALQLRKQYEQLNDSLRNEQVHNTIQELEVQYQTAEREKALAERDLQISEQRGQLERLNKWVILSVSALIMLVVVVVYSRLISQQKRKTKASEQATQLLEAQLKGEEKERARTARELHDGVASILSAAKLHINARQDEHTPSDVLISELIETAVQEIRDISHNLAPEKVFNEGFEQAVQEFCRRVNHPGMQLECYVVGELPVLGKNTGLLLYRMIQEAVTNMVKHAEATEGIVQLVGNGSTLNVTIEDNGKGFDPDRPGNPGLGLESLTSRARLLGGRLEVHSAPGKGVSIYLEIDTDNRDSYRKGYAGQQHSV